jgi:hypothetical protein
MPKPWLEADAIRFGEEEAIRMAALGTEKPEPVVLQTYTLQLLGPSSSRKLARVLPPRMIAETEENLSDLLPAGYSVTIKEWDA